MSSTNSTCFLPLLAALCVTLRSNAKDVPGPNRPCMLLNAGADQLIIKIAASWDQPHESARPTKANMTDFGNAGQ